jgi:hypothetical protein
MLGEPRLDLARRADRDRLAMMMWTASPERHQVPRRDRW